MSTLRLPEAGAGRARRPRSRLRAFFTDTPIWFLVPTLVLLGALAAYPLVVLVRMSLSDVGPTNIVGEWDFVGLENFADAIADPALGAAVGRTAAVAAVLLVSNFVLGFLSATILSSPGRTTDAVLAVMVFVWALPPIVSGSVWKFLLDDRGALNGALETIGLPTVHWLSDPSLALWSVSGIIAWAALPFSTLVIRGGLLAIPEELREASALDGAGFWRTQLSIIAPQLRPTMWILGILTVLYAFKSFDFFYVVTDGGPGTSTTTLPVLSYDRAFSSFAMSSGATVAVVALLIVVLLAVPYVRGVRREEHS